MNQVRHFVVRSVDLFFVFYFLKKTLCGLQNGTTSIKKYWIIKKEKKRNGRDLFWIA